MKVLSIVLLVAVAAVVALPVEEKPEESVVLSNFEAEQAGIDVAQINELVRDKRNYGKKKFLIARLLCAVFAVLIGFEETFLD